MTYSDEDAQRAYQSQWNAARRRAWIESQGGCCAICGSRENLEVDHVDRTSKSMNPSRLWSLSEENPLRVVELLKCQVLCRSCHRAKTRGEFVREFAHGQYGAYKRGCRCADCRFANAERVRKQRNRLSA